MIEVENLTKYYGPIKGIEDISFKIDKGEVVGLLGPNGSGKTTAMRILTCVFPPTRGKALVYGYDVTKKPLEVQRHLGYFPERAPLYPDMDVTEYLKFVARVKRIQCKKRKDQIDKSMVACGIAEIADRLIGELSKGYRQRVCLAQALLNDPEILILDEPTIGLDPRQVVEVRKLIKNLARERTVILCTHILPEVSETCERVIIIHKGRLIALDTPQNLQEKIQKHTQTLFQFHGDNGDMARKIKEVPGVIKVEVKKSTFPGAQALAVYSEKGDATLRELSTLIQKNGGPIMEMRKISLTLEEVFLELITEEELD
ncbi:MAG: ATP-binding cassette domain-containing protein [Deltaproteobacteria bacterium]|nr:ATP-binding cassette domain-containing protein [Deltaproteobacteria bacterium]